MKHILLFIGVIGTMISLVVIIVAVVSMGSGHQKGDIHWAYVGSDTNLLIIGCVSLCICGFSGLYSIHMYKNVANQSLKGSA